MSEYELTDEDVAALRHAEVTVQWEVVWFPDDVPERRKRGTEKQVRKVAEKNIEFLPIITKIVTQQAEVLVENYADRT
jgi:hypothetical protein